MNWIKHPNGKSATNEFLTDNPLINLDCVSSISKNEVFALIHFSLIGGRLIDWSFKSKEDRDSYYDGMLKKLLDVPMIENDPHAIRMGDFV